MIDNAYKKLFEAIDDNIGAKEQFVMLMREMCKYCSENLGADNLKIVYRNQLGITDHEDLLLNKRRPFYKCLQRIIKTGKASGEIPASVGISEDRLLTLLAGMAHMIIFEWCISDGQFDPAEYCDDFFKLCEAGFLQKR